MLSYYLIRIKTVEEGSPFDTHIPDGRGRRSDEDDALVETLLRELQVLRQEAIARVHGLAAGAPAHLQHLVPAQIALLGRRGADVVCLVCLGKYRETYITPL